MENKLPVSVVGGTNMDIVAKSDTTYFPGTSNPGAVIKTPGGVGRNIAHLLSRLGVPVELYSVVGDDESGRIILDSVQDSGISVEGIVMSSREKTGEYVAVQDADGTLAAAVSDMRAMDLLMPEELEKRKEKLAASSMIVADTNIPERSLLWLSGFSHERSVPLLIEPVSRDKAAKLRNLPHPAEWISPSETEFLELFRLPKRGFESILLEMDESPRSPLRLSGNGSNSPHPAKNLLVTLGKRGVVHMTMECSEEGFMQEMGLWCGRMYRPYLVETINDNGAGDAFFAGFIAALWHEKSEPEAVFYGLASAARVVRCPAAVDDDMDFRQLQDYISSHETRD